MAVITRMTDTIDTVSIRPDSQTPSMNFEKTTRAGKDLFHRNDGKASDLIRGFILHCNQQISAI